MNNSPTFKALIDKLDATKKRNNIKIKAVINNPNINGGEHRTNTIFIDTVDINIKGMTYTCKNGKENDMTAERVLAHEVSHLLEYYYPPYFLYMLNGINGEERAIEFENKVMNELGEHCDRAKHEFSWKKR